MCETCEKLIFRYLCDGFSLSLFLLCACVCTGGGGGGELFVVLPLVSVSFITQSLRLFCVCAVERKREKVTISSEYYL